MAAIPTADLAALRAEVIARLGDYPDLLLHLVSAHCNGVGLTLTEADARDYHDHEHTGPGTIRNHDRADLFWDPAKVADVIIECADMDRADDSDQAWRAAVESLLRRANEVLALGPAEHVHIEPAAVTDWHGVTCADGAACAVYPRLYDVRVERTPDGHVVGTGSASVDTPEEDIARGLLDARRVLDFAWALLGVLGERDARAARLADEAETAQIRLERSIALVHPRLYPA